MSSDLSPLLSVTFHQDGYDHLVELVHQRDANGRRHLAALDLLIYDVEGKPLDEIPVDPRQEVVDLAALLAGIVPGRERVMVAFDARYDARIFPYRPHHYGYLYRRESSAPPLYYALTAALGGVPDRVGATGINNFEIYLFRKRRFAEHFSLLLGNVSRFSPTEAQISTFYGSSRRTERVALAPKAHAVVPLAGEHDGQPLERVEVKALFRLASYVVGHRAASGDLVLLDHLFTYFK
jgi:hypothetical protein